MNRTTLATRMLERIHSLWNYMNAGPSQEWGRTSLCCLAPLSARALRCNEEAERLRAAW